MTGLEECSASCSVRCSGLVDCFEDFRFPRHGGVECTSKNTSKMTADNLYLCAGQSTRRPEGISFSGAEMSLTRVTIVVQARSGEDSLGCLSRARQSLQRSGGLSPTTSQLARGSHRNAGRHCELLHDRRGRFRQAQLGASRMASRLVQMSSRDSLVRGNRLIQCESLLPNRLLGRL